MMMINAMWFLFLDGFIFNLEYCGVTFEDEKTADALQWTFQVIFAKSFRDEQTQMLPINTNTNAIQNDGASKIEMQIQIKKQKQKQNKYKCKRKHKQKSKSQTKILCKSWYQNVKETEIMVSIESK